jgi:peptidoglycan/LPS O-acetylase OafA/YrhL
MQRKIPQLDALRGVAILAVMIHNTSGKYPSLHLEPLFRFGWMGVDLFFVLSGFLITGILLDTKESGGYFKKFYARRGLRIWPLYYSLILFMFVIVPLLRPSEAHAIFERSAPWWAYALFLQNFLIAIPTNAAGALGVTWSLAIEEQFYLIWPLVVRYFSYVQVCALSLLVIFLSPLLRIYLLSHHVYLYTNVFCRLDGLMAGALLAVFVRSKNFLPSRFTKPTWITLCAAAPLALLTDVLHAQWIAFSLTAVAAASVVYLSLFSRQHWLQAALRNWFLVYTGTISYGLYLLHKIPFDVAQSFHLERYPLLVLTISLASAFAMAALSWTLLEKPFLRLKRSFEYGIVPQMAPATSAHQLVSVHSIGNNNALLPADLIQEERGGWRSQISRQ